MKTALLILGGILLAPAPRPQPGLPAQPAADSLTIAVAVDASGGKVRAETGKMPARPLARARVGGAPPVRWFVQNKDPGKSSPQSVYHFFTTREERLGQELPREPKRGSLVDNSFAMEIPAAASTVGTCKMPIDAAGIYLV